MKRKLFLAAFAAMVTMCVNAQLIDGTVYWLQDTSTGQFLSQGDDWSTKAVTKDVGGLGFEAVLSNGNYLLKNVMWNTVKNANLGLGSDQYVDQTPVEYTITAVAGGYKVSTGGKYLVNNGTENAYKEKPIGTTTDASAATVWKFLTKTEYDAALQAYYDSRATAMATSMGLSGITTLSALETEIAGTDYIKVDQTSKITNPTIGTNWDGWTHGTISQRAEGAGVGSGCAEFWNGCGYAKQTVSNLPNGLYKVTFVGTYRPENNTNSEKLVSEKTSSPAFVYANNDKKEFLHWIDVPAKANGRGGITTSNGYSHTFYTYVTNGTMELGVIGDGWTNGNNWNPFGQFTLTQIYSLAMYQAMLDEVVASVPAYNGIIPTAAYNAIQAVVATNNVTWSTAEEYTDAIDAINTAISTYASSDIQSAYQLVLEAKALVAQTNYSGGDSEKATFQGYIDAADAATTLTDLNTAVANIKSHVLDFATAVTFDTNAYFDLTNFLVVNPTVRQNTTGWSIDEIARNNSYSWGVVNFEECEFYQQQFKFYQTLALTPGTWEFGVTGFHRAGNHSTYFYAGDDKILIPGVASSVVNTMAQAKTYFDAGNGKVALKFLIEASQDVEIGIENRDTETDRWTIFRDFTLKYYGAPDYQVYEDQWTDLVTDANTAKTAHPNVTGTELTALNAAIADSPAGANLKATYIAKIGALQTALSTFTAAAASYDKYVAYRAETVSLFGESVAATVAAPTTAAEALVAVQNLNIAQYNKVASDYTYSLNGLIGDFGSWTGTATVNGAAAEPNYLNNEHWSGITHAYYEQASAGWGSNAWTIQYQKTVTLPAGSYVIKVAARSSVDVTSSVSCTATATTISLPSEGAYTRGINTSGVASWSDSDTFARGGANNEGYGWQWRFLPFTLDAETSVTMTFYAETNKIYNWMSIADGELLSATDIAEAVAYTENADNTIQNVNVANVTLTRTIKVGYNTLVLPFTLTANQVTEAFGAGAEVYNYSENSADVNSAELNFTKGDGSITANTPVLLKATAASTEQTFNGVQIVAAEAKVEGKNFDYVGVYDNTTFAEGDYFMATKEGVQQIFESDGTDTAKPFRAYFQKKVAAPVKAILLIDGVATSISEINGDNNDAATKIFNLAGQRMQKAQKGIYIVNGKKVVIK